MGLARMLLGRSCIHLEVDPEVALDLLKIVLLLVVHLPDQMLNPNTASIVFDH